MQGETSSKIGKNLIWRFLERFGAQGVTLIVSIILARILDPEVYGTIALVTIVTSILQVFVDAGLGNALIQKKDSDEIDFSTVFYFNLFFCCIIYAIVFFISPLISRFYDNLELTSIIRIASLILIISGFKNIQYAYVSKHLLFKKFFFATLIGTIFAGVVGIWMAYNGYGVWALIVQNLVNQAVDTVVLFIIVKWKPKLVFSFSRLKKLFSYGWKLLISSLLDTIWNEMRQLIIGKKYSEADLAYYTKGQEYPKYGTSAINSSIDSVLFPVMSNVQEDTKKVKEITREAIKMSSFIMWPMMIGLAACGETFIRLFLKDKWVPALPYLQIFCIVYAFYPIHTANLNAIKAVGRSDLFLILEIIKKVLALILILITMWFGPFWMAISSIISSIISQVINSWPNKKLLNYSILEQFKDIIPTVLISGIMGICVFFMNYMQIANILKLIIQVLSGCCIYITLAFLFKLDEVKIFRKIIKNKRSKYDE